MIRLIIPVTIILLSIGTAIAQACVPDDTITQPGIYPEQLDTAFADEPYEMILQILTIKDTTASLGGQEVNAAIDSVKVTGVENLPDGFDYVCEPNNCTFTPDAVGCVKLTGNPTNNQTGEYELTIKTTAYARVGILEVPQNQDITSYKIVVKGDGTTGIDNLDNNVIKVFPNPSISGVFSLSSPINQKEVFVYTLAGKRVFPLINSASNKTTINLSSESRGVYLLRVPQPGGNLNLKLVY